VACLSGLAFDDKPLSGKSMDDLGERLAQEFQIDLTPYQSFRELRLSSNWHLEEDMQQVMLEINDDTTITDALQNLAITKDPDSQFEENLIYMRCDYLITRLKFDANHEQLRYTLRVANVLNQV